MGDVWAWEGGLGKRMAGDLEVCGGGGEGVEGRAVVALKMVIYCPWDRGGTF